MPPDPAPPLVNLFDYEAQALARLPEMVREYLRGGAGDELTLRRNRERLDALQLLPRVLRDVSRLDTSCALLGRTHRAPILIAPTAYHRLFHDAGEVATARGAAAAQVTMVVSSVATTPLDDVARACPGHRWFQLYVQRDRGFTQEVMRIAEASGYEALVLTADTPVLGSRDREKRVGFELPAHLSRANFPQVHGDRGHHDTDHIYNPHLDASLTWKDLEWLCAHTRLPIAVKGVLAPDDARLAVEHGAAAVIVSNHGGRNLDTVPATIDALPGVVAAVAGRVPVLMDGGVRRGTDVLKALALGARAVLIGRPVIWGLACNGEHGVERVLQLLRLEFEAAMALCGLTSLDRIGPEALWNRP